MDSYTPSLAELEARLAKLERQNRRWKRLGLFFLLIAGSGFVLAQAPRKSPSAAPAAATRAGSFDTLVVRRLELRDKAGKLRGLWTVTDDGPGLWLYDTAGQPRAGLCVMADGPVLTLVDAAGEVHAGLSVTPEGSELKLYDAAGKARAGLTVDALGPGLWLYDAAVVPRAQLGQGGLVLRGATGRAALLTGESGPSLELYDAQQFKAVVGVTRLETIRTGESSTTSAAAVTLFGKDGKVIWRAP